MITAFRAGQADAEPFEANALAATLAVPGKYLLADVSEFQPSVDDAKYLAWSKAMVIRAAFGDQHDDKAWYNGQRRDALHAGGALFLGIYQFLVAGQSGAAQAAALHRLVGALRKGEVLIADLEQGDKTMLTEWYNTMRAWYPAQYLWTYTGESFGTSAGILPVEWIAAYRAAEPASPHQLWQFSQNYTVPGVGIADCSVFHGTVGQLAALACQGHAVIPPAAHSPAPVLNPVGLHSTGSSGTFTWHPVTGHAAYRWQLEYYKGGFGWVLADDQAIHGTTVTVPLNPRSNYRWRVAAGDWSAWQTLDTP